jgi:hypothetical protein
MRDEALRPFGALPGFQHILFQVEDSPLGALQQIEKIGLLALPAHLLKAWATQVDFASVQVDEVQFPVLAQAVLEFLRFKKLPVAPACRCQLAMTPPGFSAVELLFTGSGDPEAHFLLINLSNTPVAFEIDYAAMGSGVPRYLMGHGQGATWQTRRSLGLLRTQSSEPSLYFVAEWQ